MKIFLALLVVAVIAGSAIGYTSTVRRYSWTDEKFGYFTKGGDLQPKDLLAHMRSLQQEGLAKVEVVGGAEFDFGSMLREADGEHDFVIKNVGDGPLELSVLRTTCKCTLGELADSSLEPGESTVVHMAWSAKTSGARFQQTATISTTDPYNGELELRIVGDVVDRLTARPSSWNVGEISSTAAIEKTCTIYSRIEYDIQFKENRWLAKIAGADVDLDVQPVPVDTETALRYPDTRQAFQATLKVSPGMETGLFSHTAIVEFEPVEAKHASEKKSGELSTLIKFEGRVVDDLSLSGGSRLAGRSRDQYIYTLPPVAAGEGTSSDLLVLLRGPHRDDTKLSIGEVQPAEVLAAELGDPKVKENLVMHVLKLRVREDAPVMQRDGNQKDDYGTVWIKSDNEEVAPLRLRVKFNVHDGR
ncbi:DUF1573 domain-containing protein [Roseimaritima ulvae]|uniref:DUF1573 domain-containing protein n=1 Tax=Roseimaritima ulvae TaxID=980254 RepID=UPI00138FFE04|nr:DUF1573 domain-containing protein [Roseimaritima ulvae]